MVLRVALTERLRAPARQYSTETECFRDFRCPSSMRSSPWFQRFQIHSRTRPGATSAAASDRYLPARNNNRPERRVAPRAHHAPLRLWTERLLLEMLRPVLADHRG